MLKETFPSHYAYLDDEQLVTHCQNGDKAAFDTLFVKHETLASRTLYQRFGQTLTPLDIEDLLQIAALKAFNNIKKFKGDSKFSTWLCRIAINSALDEVTKFRQTRDRANHDINYDDDSEVAFLIRSVPEESLGPLASLISEDNAAVLDAAIESLPSKLKQVLEFREINGFSYQEIAETMDMPVGTVKSSLHSAKKRVIESCSKEGFVPSEPELA